MLAAFFLFMLTCAVAMTATVTSPGSDILTKAALLKLLSIWEASSKDMARLNFI